MENIRTPKSMQNENTLGKARRNKTAKAWYLLDVVSFNRWLKGGESLA